MRINGYWLGASILTIIGLIFDSIRYNLMYPSLGMDTFPTVLYIIFFIVFLGLAFPKDKSNAQSMKKVNSK